MRSLRITQYMDEYLNQLHNIYKTEVNCILCTYYQLDIENSVCDKSKLYNGTWEYVGEYSGYKWKKIELFPIAYVSDASPMDLNSDKDGNTANITFTAVIPSSYGVYPHAMDFMTINSSVLFENLPEDETTFVINHINRSNFGKKFFYQMKMKNKYIKTEDLDIQSEEYVFVEMEKKVYPKEQGIKLLKLLEIDFNLTNDVVKKKYIWDRGFYSQPEE